MTGHVHLHPADSQGIATLRFSHPGKLNALTVQMWRDLRALLEGLNRLDADEGPRVIVVQGEGGSFVAGADIEEFPDFRFDAETLAHYHEEVVAPALDALLDCERPLVAQIEGACVGGGLEIAACCDIRLCGESSRVGVPIAKLGFPMAPHEIEIVVRVIGETTLRELLLEARVLTAAQARERGLVTRVVPDAQVAAEAARTPGHGRADAGFRHRAKAQQPAVLPDQGDAGARWIDRTNAQEPALARGPRRHAVNSRERRRPTCTGSRSPKPSSTT